MFACPRGHDLHADGIDQCKGHPGSEAEDDRCSEFDVEQRDCGVQRSAGECPGGDDLPRFPHIGHVEQRTRQRAGDEAELDGHGEPSELRARKLPVVLEDGCYCGRREPQAHSQQLGKGEPKDDTPFHRRVSSVGCGCGAIPDGKTGRREDGK